MTIAEIHGKSPLTTSEDLLTANVLTAFRYLPAGRGIVGFLRSIKGVDYILPEPDDQTKCEYFFWPLGETREPDVLLELHIRGELYHVVVEAKYLSGPSDAEIVQVDEEETISRGNQLADQFRELRLGTYTIRVNGRRRERKVLRSRPENRLLLYLTAHPLRPLKELAMSAALYPPAADRLCWASWYDVYDYLRASQDHFSSFPSDRVVGDILELLAQKDFSSFQGVRAPSPQKGWHNVRGTFWRGRRELFPAFHGVRSPEGFETAVAGPGFWKGRRGMLPVFRGIALPSPLDGKRISGTFWLN
jgi:hypothetical protein